MAIIGIKKYSMLMIKLIGFKFFYFGDIEPNKYNV